MPIFKKTASAMRGLTLTELLIATTILTVVLIGLGVANLGMRRMDSGFSREASLYLQLEAIGENIRYSARKAVGTQTDPGIIVDASIYNMCFRIPKRDSPATSVASPDTLKWRCYSLLFPPPPKVPVIPPPKPSRTYFYTCDLPDYGACTNDGTKNNGVYLGQLDKDTFSTAGADRYCNAPNFLVTGDDHSFKFKLIARKDPTVGASPITDPRCSLPLDKGTEKNPQVVIEYTIYPEAYSF